MTRTIRVAGETVPPLVLVYGRDGGSESGKWYTIHDKM